MLSYLQRTTKTYCTLSVDNGSVTVVMDQDQYTEEANRQSGGSAIYRKLDNNSTTATTDYTMMRSQYKHSTVKVNIEGYLDKLWNTENHTSCKSQLNICPKIYKIILPPTD